MSLRIDQFNTTCHVPPQRRGDAELVDRLARGRFARDLGEHLGPSLARQPAIVRIRRLPMRVIIPASELNEDALSLKWRQEFGRALFTALAYPTGAGPFEVFRSESVAAFIASAIRDLLDGTAGTKWQYAEFETFFRRGSTQAALALICEWPRQSMAVLLELAQRGLLDHLLARFDDVAMEGLFAVLARPPDSETEPLSVGDLIATAKLALTCLPEKAIALRSRAYALSLFVEAHRARQPLPSPRALFHALLAIAVLLNAELLRPDAAAWPFVTAWHGALAWPDLTARFGVLAKLALPGWPDVLHAEPLAKRLPSNVTALLERLGKDIRRQLQSSFSTEIPGGGPQLRRGKSPSSTANQESPMLEGQLAELNQLLTSLGTQLKVPPPQPLPPSPEVRWISSEWCGLFFLTSTLARLGWIRAWRNLAAFQTGGVACLAAGLALAIAEKFDPTVPALDPGIALFAGYLGDPDMAHLRQVFQEFPHEVRTSVLSAVLAHQVTGDAPESWQGIFDRLAETLLRDFASRIRGFRQATRQGIVRSFIARPGRIRIEPERLVVYPAPSAFNVALHISGMDDPVTPIWLGGRRIEFELGDL